MLEFSTERLFLEQLLSTDADQILALRSSHEVNRFLDRVPMHSLQEAGAFIEKIRNGYSDRSVYYWAIRQTKNGPLIGTICLWNISADLLSAEIGYEMLPRFQGKGFMMEAIQSTIKYAFENIGIRELNAYTHKENLASIHLLNKMGFAGPEDPPAGHTNNDFIFTLESHPDIS